MSMYKALAQCPCGFKPWTEVSTSVYAVAFTVLGVPVPKGRARSFVRNGRVGHFTPEKTVVYENLVAYQAGVAMGAQKPLEGAVSLKMGVYLPIPASWSKKRQQAALGGLEAPSKKPDLDNIIKALCDGMNDVVWLDDAQVVAIQCTKAYSDNPRVEVMVTA